MSTTLRGATYGLTAAAIWGGMYVVSDIVLQVIPPFTLLTIRLLLGILSLGVLVWYKRGSLQFPTRRETGNLLIVGLVGFGISVGAQFVGTDRSTAVNGALVTSASPTFILIFAAIILREKLSLQRIMAVVLASIGVIVIIDPSKADFGSATFMGDIALAIAAVTWGLYSVLVRKVSAKLDTILVTFFAFIGGLLLTLPAAVLELQSRPIGTVHSGELIGILYLGIISTAVAMWMWNRAFALLDASVASLFFFAQPLVGGLLGILILDQQLTNNLLIGGFLIAVGVLLSIYPLGKLRQKNRAFKTTR